MKRTLATSLLLFAAVGIALGVGAPAKHSTSLSARSNNPPPDVLFEGAGTLQLGPQGCVNLHADAGPIYALSETGGFQIGDRVFISGEVIEESTYCYPAIMPGIDVDTVQRFFEGAGMLEVGPQTCVDLVTDSGEVFALGNVDGYFFGDRVYVTGAVDEESQMCWPVIWPGIEDNTIAGFFEGVGVLVLGPQGCMAFAGLTGEFYVIENAGDFVPGDLVYITGVIDEDSDFCFPYIGPGLVDNTIDAAQ